MNNDVKVMQLFVDTMVGIERFSYPAKKNAPRPSGETFAHIQMIEEYQEGIPAQRIIHQDAETTTMRVESLSLLRYRIGIVDTDGIASQKIANGWTSEKIKALMYSTGYAFVLAMPIGIEDAKLETDWEARQGVSVEMYVTRSYEQTVDNITSLEVTGEFITPLETFLLNINVNE